MKSYLMIMILCTAANLSAMELPAPSGIVGATAVDGTEVYAATKRDNDDQNPRLQHYENGRWTDLGGQISGSVHAMAASGGRLYVGGEFTLQDGERTIENLVCWENGKFSALGNGLDGRVYALSFEGTDLYVGGAFTNAGNLVRENCDWPVLARTDGIAIWRDQNWVALDQGITGSVNAIVAQGETVYAAGNFSVAEGAPSATVAAWNGEQWQEAGTGLEGQVYSLVSDGTGLYAAGNLSVDGKVSRVAHFDGQDWTALGSFEAIPAVLGYHNGILLVGGNFETDESQPYNYLASWDGFEWRQVNSAPAGAVTGLTRTDGGFLVASEDTEKSLIFIQD